MTDVPPSQPAAVLRLLHIRCGRPCQERRRRVAVVCDIQSQHQHLSAHVNARCPQPLHTAACMCLTEASADGKQLLVLSQQKTTEGDIFRPDTLASLDPSTGKLLWNLTLALDYGYVSGDNSGKIHHSG